MDESNNTKFYEYAHIFWIKSTLVFFQVEDLLELPLPLPIMQIIRGKMLCYFFYPLEINSLTTIAHFNSFTQKPQKANEGLDYQIGG